MKTRLPNNLTRNNAVPRECSVANAQALRLMRHRTRFVKAVVRELLNPKLTVATKRTQSIVKQEYIKLLDNWFDPNFSAKHYPQNCRGSLTRIDAPSLEFFVDIPALYNRIVSTTQNGELKQALLHCRRAGLAGVRDVLVEAIKILGERDFKVEWNDQATIDNYDIDLNQLTSAYSVGNDKVRAQSMRRLEQWRDEGAPNEFVILDAGVGIGGTIAPIVKDIMARHRAWAMTESSLKRIKIVLFDTDANKVIPLRKALHQQFGFPLSNIAAAPGEFYYMEENQGLSPFLGRVDLVVSGAAISHTSDKTRAFRQIFRLLRAGGEIITWDAFLPFLNSPYIKIGPRDSWARTVEISSQQGRRRFRLGQGEPMTEEMLQLQEAGAEVRTSTEISAQTASGYISDVVHMSTTLLGYNKEVIGREPAEAVRREAREYILAKMRSGPGFSMFDYLEWLNERMREYPIPLAQRPPFKLLDSLENVAAYQAYCVQAGFSLEHFEYFNPAQQVADLAASGNEPAAAGLLIVKK